LTTFEVAWGSMGEEEDGILEQMQDAVYELGEARQAVLEAAATATDPAQPTVSGDVFGSIDTGVNYHYDPFAAQPGHISAVRRASGYGTADDRQAGVGSLVSVADDVRSAVNRADTVASDLDQKEELSLASDREDVMALTRASHAIE
jgi:hypothetical protein